MTDRPPIKSRTAAFDDYRRRHPERFVDRERGEFLFVQNVAELLGCNEDFVRRIPRSELPAAKVGKRLLYSRTDLETYIRRQRDAGSAPMIGRRSAVPALPAPDATPFDPVQHVRSKTKAPR